MSRKQWQNNKFCLAAGVDRVTSAFFEVFVKVPPPSDELVLSENDEKKYDAYDEEMEGYLVLVVDNTGVHERNLPGIYIPVEIQQKVAELKQRFKVARGQGNFYPNLDEATVAEIAQRLGFNIRQEIYQIWGDDV